MLRLTLRESGLSFVSFRLASAFASLLSERTGTGKRRS